MVVILIVLAATGESLAELRGPVERHTALDFIENVLDAVDGQAVTITVSGLPSEKSERADRAQLRADSLMASFLPAFKAMAKELGLRPGEPFQPGEPDVEIHDPPTEEGGGDGADFEEVPEVSVKVVSGKRRGA